MIRALLTLSLVVVAAVVVARTASPAPGAPARSSAQATASPTPAPSATPAGAASPGEESPEPVATPAATPAAPIPSPLGTPSPPGSASPAPAPSASPAYHYVYTPPAAGDPNAPRILSISMTDQTVHENSDVALRVLTTPQVATVVASAFGRDVAIPQESPGVFAARSHIPNVPFFLLRTYDVEFRAATQDGQSTSVTVQLRLAR